MFSTTNAKINNIQVHGGVEEAAEMARDARFYTLTMLLSTWKASPSLILRQEFQIYNLIAKI